MNTKGNLYLMAIVAILLIVSFFKLPFEYYQIIRFIVTAIFLWLIISYNGKENLGLRFFFGVLAVLFNPFYKIDIGRSLLQIVDLVTASLLIILIIQNSIGFKVLMNLSVHFFIKKKMLYVIMGIAVLLGITIFAINQHKEYKLKKEAEIQALINKRVHDSTVKANRISDSLSVIFHQIEARKTDSLVRIYCTEKAAIIAFKEWMEFYHPTWKIKSKLKVKCEFGCVYQISVIVRNNLPYSDDETLIVEINLSVNGFGNRPQFYEMETPGGFDS